MTFLLLIVALSPVLASEMPEPFKATYDVQASGIKVGEMERELRHPEEGTWVFETSLRSTGITAVFKPHHYVERSTWREEDGHLVPVSYVAHYRGAKEDRVLEQDLFHWERGIVESSRKGRIREVPLAEGVMDKQLYQLALRRDLERGKRSIAYRVADRGKVRDYRFEVLGEETLKTDLGELRTLKVAKDKTIFWVAPSLDYAVVKLSKEEDSIPVTSYITRLKQ